MGKKMKLPSLFKPTESSANSWSWPSCAYPKTLSFRAPGGDIFKTINSAYIDDVATAVDMPEEPCLATSEPESFSAKPEATKGGGDDQSIEAVIRDLRSAERLFFDPGETSSVLDANSRISVGGVHDEACEPQPHIQVCGEHLSTKPVVVVEVRACSLLMQSPPPTATAADAEEMPFEESEVVEMETRDPHVEFKRSMEEMVVAHGLKDWECLEELLSWYLRVNGKRNHGYIIGAFVDLLVGNFAAAAAASSSSILEDQSSSSSAQSPTCPLSFSSSSWTNTSPYLSSLETEDEIQNPITDFGSS